MLTRVLQAGAVIALVMVVGITVAWGRQSGPEPDTPRAIQELTQEIRQLRAAVTHSAETQLQGQVIGLQLTFQQGRLSQATARRDSVRKELETAAARASEVAGELERLDTRLPQETDPVRRKQFEREVAAIKQHLEQLTAQEQQIRGREAEVYQTEQTEEARWNELIAKLEQLVKK